MFRLYYREGDLHSFFLLMFNTILFRVTGRSCVGLSDLLLLLGDWLLVTFFILGNDCALAV